MRKSSRKKNFTEDLSVSGFGRTEVLVYLIVSLSGKNMDSFQMRAKDMWSMLLKKIQNTLTFIPMFEERRHSENSPRKHHTGFPRCTMPIDFLGNTDSSQLKNFQFYIGV